MKINDMIQIWRRISIWIIQRIWCVLVGIWRTSPEKLYLLWQKCRMFLAASSGHSGALPVPVCASCRTEGSANWVQCGTALHMNCRYTCNDLYTFVLKDTQSTETAKRVFW